MPILFGNEFLIAGFVLTTIIFIMKSKRFDRVIVSYNLVFLALFGLHLLAYDKFILGIIVAYFMRIYFAYFTVKIIGKDIDKYIVNQIYFFSIISLIITFLIFINPSLADFIYSNITPVI
jgi:heme O synthase-like polyprenyltransferase